MLRSSLESTTSSSLFTRDDRLRFRSHILDAIALIAQPLLRGAGRKNNTRYIAIAKTNTKISSAILDQHGFRCRESVRVCIMTS